MFKHNGATKQHPEGHAPLHLSWHADRRKKETVWRKGEQQAGAEAEGEQPELDAAAGEGEDDGHHGIGGMEAGQTMLQMLYTSRIELAEVWRTSFDVEGKGKVSVEAVLRTLQALNALEAYPLTRAQVRKDPCCEFLK